MGVALSEAAAELAPEVAARRRVAVVLNGAAGALLTRADALEATRALFAAEGLEAAFIPPEAGTLPARIAAARDSGADAVVVGGGDGTIACAATAMAGSDTPLAILPLGTMNLLAHDLGLPVGDLEAAVRVVRHGVVRRIDIAAVNGHAFLCASMLGLPARLARFREQRRGRMALPVRAWRMATAAIRALRQERYGVLSVQAGPVAQTMRSASLTVAVNAYDPEGGRGLFARPVLDGGELALYAIGRVHWRDVLRLARGLAMHNWQHDAQILHSRAGSITVSARKRAIRVMNDGEVMLLQPPLRYEIRPRALAVLVPPVGPKPT